MPSRHNAEIAAQYENFSIYVMLKTRGSLPGFHWGLFIRITTPVDLWHATNQSGGWDVPPTSTDKIPFSMSLVLAYKIGSITPMSPPRMF